MRSTLELTSNPIVDFERYNPHRRPDWRFRRVNDLLKKRKRGRRVEPVAGRDDRWIREGFLFLRAWERYEARDHDNRCRGLFHKHPAVYLAYTTYAADSDVLRNVIEARILARESNKAIGKAVGLPREAIQAYERMFFNVRDRLDNRDYIAQQVIGVATLRGLQNLRYDLSAKFFGYFAGPKVLTAVMNSFDESLKFGRDGNLDNFYDTHFATQLRRACAEASGFHDLNRFNAEKMFELHLKLIETARLAEAEEAAGKKSGLEEVVGAMLQSVPWTVGSKRDKALADSPLKPYLGHTAEPRAQDMLLIASGQLPYTVDDLKDRKFPPPRIKDDPNAKAESG